MIFVLVATSVYSVFGQSIRPGFSPPDGCYTPKLVTTYQGTLYNIPESGQNIAIYDFPKYNEKCYYRFTLQAKTDNCAEVLFNVGKGQNGGQEFEFGISDNWGDTEYIESYWDPQWPPPETIEIRIFNGECNLDGIGNVEYTIQVYEECACNKKSLPIDWIMKKFGFGKYK